MVWNTVLQHPFKLHLYTPGSLIHCSKYGFQLLQWYANYHISKSCAFLGTENSNQSWILGDRFFSTVQVNYSTFRFFTAPAWNGIFLTSHFWYCPMLCPTDKHTGIPFCSFLIKSDYLGHVLVFLFDNMILYRKYIKKTDTQNC